MPPFTKERIKEMGIWVFFEDSTTAVMSLCNLHSLTETRIGFLQKGCKEVKYFLERAF